MTPLFANTSTRYGLISRTLHWVMAGLILALLVLGLWLAQAAPSLQVYTLFMWHKTGGMVVLALFVLRVLWHRISPPPRPVGRPDMVRLARAAHGAIYALMAALPLAGWVGSSASGIDTVIFGTFVLPPIAPVSAAVQDAAFALHGALAWGLMGLIGLHVAAGLWHGWRGDGTLARMGLGRR